MKKGQITTLIVSVLILSACQPPQAELIKVQILALDTQQQK